MKENGLQKKAGLSAISAERVWSCRDPGRQFCLQSEISTFHPHNAGSTTAYTSTDTIGLLANTRFQGLSRTLAEFVPDLGRVQRRSANHAQDDL